MTTTMPAAVSRGTRDVRLQPLPIPELVQGKCLLQGLGSGLCGTDALGWDATPKVFFVSGAYSVAGHVGPVLPGHESVGRGVQLEEDAGQALLRRRGPRRV